MNRTLLVSVHAVLLILTGCSSSSPDSTPDAGAIQAGNDAATKPEGKLDSGSPSDASDGGSAPSCATLQSQAVACPDLPAEMKPKLEEFCGLVSEDCRACLDGKTCGEGDSCAAKCEVATSPSCADIKAEIDACAAFSDSTKAQFAASCAGTSATCRACLKGNLCGVTQQCDSVCTSK